MKIIWISTPKFVKKFLKGIKDKESKKTIEKKTIKWYN